MIKLRFLFAMVFMFGLSLHATEGNFFKNPSLMKIGVAGAIVSVMGIVITSFATAYACSDNDQEKCKKISQTVIPAFIVTVAGSALAIIGSMFKCCVLEPEGGYSQV